MNKTRRFRFKWVNAGPYIATYAIAVLVMLVVFIQRGFWPLGDRCFLCTDLYHQYAPFFRELQTKLWTGGSLFYSWNIGGGTNFWALSAYYLASPVNVLIALVPREYVIEFITADIVNKIALSAVTMAYYLNKKHDRHGADGYAGGFIGLFYALSGWMAAYNWNVMWLDCIWLFPLIILGLERLVRENKGLLYSVSLGLSIFSNYYISVMTCMGVAVYCFYLLGTEREMLRNFGIKLLKFIFYTALAVGSAAVFLIPYIRYFSMTASASSTFTWAWTSYFPLLDMLARQLMNVEVHKGLEHWPNIYAGMCVFLLIPLYYMNRKITLREKIGYTIVLIFFYFSFSTRAMDYIWHVFHIPNSLPCRQSFIFIFIVLTMCYRGLMGMKDRSYRDLTFAMLASLALIFLAEKLRQGETVAANYVVYVSALFVVLYAIVFYIMKRGRVYRDIVIVLFFLLAAVELTVNTTVTSVPTVSRSDYLRYDEGVSEAMALIREKEGGDTFYRVEMKDMRTKNDGAWLSFPSVSTFSSVANANLTAFYKTLGLESSMNAYGSKGQTFFTNMLMGVKYSIAKKELPESDLYTLTYTDDKNIWVYENAYYLPLGFVVDDPNAIYDWPDSAVSPLMNQNNLADNVLNGSPLFMDLTPASLVSSAHLSVTIEEDGFYYAYSTKSGPKEIKVVNSNQDYNVTYKELSRGYTMVLNYCEKGDVITFDNVQKDSTKSINLNLYKLNESVLKELCEALSEAPLVIDSFTDTEVRGHIAVPAGGGLLMTTIAAEEGWEMYVDGVKVEYETLKGAYIGKALESGSHEIIFRYHVPLFAESLIISIFCGLIMLLIALSPLYREKLMKRLFKKKLPADENEDEIITDAAETQDGADKKNAADGQKDPENTEIPENTAESEKDPSDQA